MRPDVRFDVGRLILILNGLSFGQDWQLYNRVGATMANSGRAEEALQYYYRALELNPVYIRARLVFSLLVRPELTLLSS